MGHADRSGNVDKRIGNAISKLWILFADHEIMNSTAAYLHATSSLADPISCMVSAISSCPGPLHAGAIDLAYKRYSEIHATEGGLEKHIEDAKAKKLRLISVSHHVYRTVNPRVGYLREMTSEFQSENISDPLLEVARGIEDAVSNGHYFVSRKRSINDDLHGSFIYAAL